MSGDFGWCSSGYVHTVIAEASDMCDNGKHEMTRKFAVLLKSLVYIALDVAYAESDDIGIDTAMQNVAENLPRVQESLSSLRSYVEGRHE